MGTPIPQARSVLEHVLGFGRALHEAGFAVNPGNIIDLCRCFAFLDFTQRSDFHAAARAMLVSRRDEIPQFDAVFSRYWDMPCELPDFNSGDDEARQEEDGASGVGLAQPANEGSGDGTDRRDDSTPSYSHDETLALRDLGTLTDADIERARRLIHEMLAALANRRTRRWNYCHRGGSPDPRRLLRTRAFHHSEGICPLPHRVRRLDKTRLVLLADVSGSMQRYSAFLIEFMYALRREVSTLEVAVFSTQLTVITDLLRSKGVEASLREVASKVSDWSGGTNIGGSLSEFNGMHASGMLNSRTAVILLSDGWDCGDPVEMRAEMRKLRQRARTVIWLNPLLGTADFQPLTRGMQSALPHIDHLLPAHNLQSLSQLAKTLRALGA